ncbi:NTP transferase domain-containing protein [Candidatus Woesebacteria bacterium]|nr:NTP transferase domain-containing protein [Candidatus Woesebacteria bacterium]
MKGVILAGGLGTRLYPLTHVTNKHLLPIYNKPMIFYPIETLVNAGVTEILIVTSGPHVGDFLGVLKNGKELGVTHLEYAYQERPDGGIPDALALAEDFADNKPIAVILGDNTTDALIREAVEEFTTGSLVFLKKYENQEQLMRFGVPVFDETGKKITAVEEKPKEPKSDYAQTGLYLYDNTVFDRIRGLAPSARGELEVSDLNSLYASEGALTWAELNGYWSDAGTFQSMMQASWHWAQKENVVLE